MRWRRPRRRVYPEKPKTDIRATRPNEYWHIDVTVIRRVDDTRAYLHAVMDNFSRRILSWRLARRLDPLITCEILKEAGKNLQQTAHRRRRLRRRKREHRSRPADGRRHRPLCACPDGGQLQQLPSRFSRPSAVSASSWSRNTTSLLNKRESSCCNLMKSDRRERRAASGVLSSRARPTRARDLPNGRA